MSANATGISTRTDVGIEWGISQLLISVSTPKSATSPQSIQRETRMVFGSFVCRAAFERADHWQRVGAQTPQRISGSFVIEYTLWSTLDDYMALCYSSPISSAS